MQIAELEAEAAQGRMTMSLWRVQIIAVNPREESRVSQPIEALVDTGSENTWLPADVLRSVGIEPRFKCTYLTATNTPVEREVGYAILRAEGFECNDHVVFAEPGDMPLLGVRTMEGFGVSVDPIAHRFSARPMIAAPTTKQKGGQP